LSPTSGFVARIAGLDVVEGCPVNQEQNRRGFRQEFALFQELTPMENLWYIGELYGMHKDDIRKRSVELLRTVDLPEVKNKVSATFPGA